MQTKHSFRATSTLLMEAIFYSNLIFHDCALRCFYGASDEHNDLISNVKHICVSMLFLYAFSVWETGPEKPQQKSVDPEAESPDGGA